MAKNIQTTNAYNKSSSGRRKPRFVIRSRRPLFLFMVGFSIIGGTLWAKTFAAPSLHCPAVKSTPISSPQGQRNGRPHNGIDIDSNYRDAVYAAHDGDISYDDAEGGYGRTLNIYTDIHNRNTGFSTKYAHLDAPAVTSGRVHAGQLIGYVDSTGSSTGHHLHWEVRHNGALQNSNDYWRDCGGGGSGAAPPTGAPAPTPATPAGCNGQPTLRQGSRGPCVKALQQKLIAIGCLPPGQDDGIFGPKTKAAVQCAQARFPDSQSCRGTAPSTCDGIVGPKTWAAIGRDVGPIDNSNPPGSSDSPAPQPGAPGQAGSSNCVGGCKPGQPGASNPGTPGASNPGKATQGSPGAPGSPGARGSSGTSGTSGTQGSRGSQGGVSIGGQSQGSSYSGSTKTSCKSGTCTTTTPDGKTTTTKAASSNNKPPAVAQYVIRSHASGRCMDADGTTRGKDTQIWDCTGNSNQKWGLASDGTIRLAASGLCLEVEGGDTDNGSDVQIYDCNGGSHQRWQWNSDGTIRSTATGKCLDVKDNNTANGTNLQIWDCYKGASNQRWGTW